MTLPDPTARAVLAALEQAGCSPRVAGEALSFTRRPPRELFPLVRVLHTGIRAVLTGRTWLGCSTDTGWSAPLDPGAAVPDWCGLLCVQGDSAWDRMTMTNKVEACEMNPAVFDVTPEPRNWSERTRDFRRRAAA
jgi:hypothetical protein